MNELSSSEPFQIYSLLKLLENIQKVAVIIKDMGYLIRLETQLEFNENFKQNFKQEFNKISKSHLKKELFKMDVFYFLCSYLNIMK